MALKPENENIRNVKPKPKALHLEIQQAIDTCGHGHEGRIRGQWQIRIAYEKGVGIEVCRAAAILWSSNDPVDWTRANDLVKTAQIQQLQKSHAKKAGGKCRKLEEAVVNCLDRSTISLISALGNENTASPAALALAEAAKTILSTLILALGDTHASIRQSAAAALGWMASRVKEMIPALIKTLKDGDESVCETVASALGRIGELAIPALHKAALGDEESQVRFYSVFALGWMESPAAVQALIHALDDEDEAVREIAVDALRQIKSLEAMKAVEQYSSS